LDTIQGNDIRVQKYALSKSPVEKTIHYAVTLNCGLNALFLLHDNGAGSRM
jgi:hypothetical protein